MKTETGEVPSQSPRLHRLRWWLRSTPCAGVVVCLLLLYPMGWPAGRADEQPIILARSETLVRKFPENTQAPIQCIPAEERQNFEYKITDWSVQNQRSSQPAQPLTYEFNPQAGTLWRDLFVTNFVDLDPSGGFKDWDCSGHTYDGHRGHDIDILSFQEQDIGTPVFAALDGRVCQLRDGDPDKVTVPAGAIGNYVAICHGNVAGYWTTYWHLKRGSVLVTLNQQVVAGQQIGLTGSSGQSTGPHLHFETVFNQNVHEPSAGPCRTGASTWINQTPIRRELYVRDFSFSTEAYDKFLPPPHDDAPRVGTFVAGNRTVYYRLMLANQPANSTWRVRFMRPDGSVARDSNGVFPGGSFFRRNDWWFTSSLDLNTTGTWRLVFSLNDQTIVEAPFGVVASAEQIVNRPPNRISAAFDPVAPQPEQVVSCRVENSQIYEDPDYEVVRYRYRWQLNGSVVREVTSAALSDAIPRNLARHGDQLTCTVTPSDGKAEGLAVITTIKVGIPVVVSTSAASFDRNELAAESIVAVFGTGLATLTQAASALPLPTSLAGTQVLIRDSAGVERLAPLFFVSPQQINYLLPPELAAGLATVTVTSRDGAVSFGGALIHLVAPGLFTANANGQGVVAAVVLRRRADGTEQFEPVARFDPAQNRFVPTPIALSAASEQVFLLLFGTGFRSGIALRGPHVSIGGLNVPVLYAGPQGELAGLDQANVELPCSLAGRGEVEVVLSADGRTSNIVKLALQ